MIGTHVTVPKVGSLQSIPVALWGRRSYFTKKTDEQMTTSTRAPSLPPSLHWGVRHGPSPSPPGRGTGAGLAPPPGVFPYLLRRLSQASWEREERSREQKAPEDSCSPVLGWSNSDHPSEPLSWAVFTNPAPSPQGCSWGPPGPSAVCETSGDTAGLNPGHLPEVLSSLWSIWYHSPTTTARPEPTRMAWSLQMVGRELNHHVYSFVQLT